MHCGRGTSVLARRRGTPGPVLGSHGSSSAVIMAAVIVFVGTPTQKRRAQKKATAKGGPAWPVYPASAAICLLWSFVAQTHLFSTTFRIPLYVRGCSKGVSGMLLLCLVIPVFHAIRLAMPKASLETLLLWGTVVAVPQMIPLLFIHSVSGALMARTHRVDGGGVAISPPIWICSFGPALFALQGTTLMMAGSLYWIATRFRECAGCRLWANRVLWHCSRCYWSRHNIGLRSKP